MVRGYNAKRLQPARGTKHENQVQISILMDQEMFEEVRDMAKKNQSSFAEQVRLLVQFGLEDIANDER